MTRPELENSQTYPVTLLNALVAVYLWLFFGYLTAYMNCDLQHILQNNVYVLHLFGIVTFFFLFMTDVASAQLTLSQKIALTLVVYIMWIMASKTRYYFIMGIIGTIIVVKLLDNHIEDKLRYGHDKENIQFLQHRRKMIYLFGLAIIVLLIFIGIVHALYQNNVKLGNLWSFFVSRSVCR